MLHIEKQGTKMLYLRGLELSENYLTGPVTIIDCHESLSLSISVKMSYD